jgi:5'-nucleotidase/UDP-sugar diphosphatase
MKFPTLCSLVGLASLSRGTNAQTFELNILHVNDHHSHLQESDFDLDPMLLSSAVGEPALTVKYGGFPRLVSLTRSLGTSLTNVLKLHAGDALFGTSLYSVYRGVADAEMMNAVCFDAFALGNHEFDDGDANLAEFITTLRGSTDCPNTPVLAANLVPGPDSALLPLQVSGAIAPYIIQSFGDEQVGVIGIDIRGKTLLSSSPDPGTTLLDERETVIAQVAALTALGVNKIVLLTHIGLAKDLEWMTGIEGVDVVVGGDSHTLLGADVAPVFMTQGEYPAVTTTALTDGRKVCVVQAWDYAHVLGHLNVVFDELGDVISCGGSPKIPFEVDAMATDSEIVKSYLEDLGPAFVQVEEDEAAKTALQVYLDDLQEQLGTMIATVPENICYERIPGQGRSEFCTAESTANMGGAACNVVAQAFLDQTPSGDVAIQNGGGCRTDIAAGDFSLESAFTLLPFSNTLVTLDLTGAQIKIVLEEALENALMGGSTGAYPYAAGLRYAVDANKDMGNRISSLEVNIRLAEASWNAIDAGMAYTVVTNNFIAGGKDGYFEFDRVDKELVVDTFKEYAQSFIDYAIQEETLVSPPLATFSTQSFVPVEEVTDEPVDEVTDEPVDEVTDEPVDEVTDEPVDEVTDEPVDEATDEPVDEDSSAGKSLISLFGIATTLLAAFAL